jgi:hypothetical protein
MKGRALRVAPWTAVLTTAASVCAGQQTLYGGNQWLQVSSVNNGLLVTVDADTGATTPIGKPSGVDRLSGLAFDAAGTLWASTVTGTPSGTLRTSTLITLDPADGSILSTIGPVLDGPGGLPMGLESLAVQPGTDILLGTRGIADQNLRHAADVYRIDKTTGVATLLFDNNNGFQEATIAFAPDGTLYQALASCCSPFGGNPKFEKLDPATGAVLMTVSMSTYVKALAVGADGTVVAAAPQNLFASDVSDFYRIDPATGAATKLGDTGHNPIGALAFGAAAACERDCIQPRVPILPATPVRSSPRVVERPSP